jgi:hypothetical protein
MKMETLHGLLQVIGLDSDVPLIGSDASNETEPQISNFNATIYMVKNSDGRDFHQHRIYNFRQAAVSHEGANSTTVNGTFTVFLLQGPTDVNGYIHLINDKIELWLDPVATDNHFGLTTITGMILDPERLSIAEKGFRELIGRQGTTTTTTTSTGSVQQ